MCAFVCGCVCVYMCVCVCMHRSLRSLAVLFDLRVYDLCVVRACALLRQQARLTDFAFVAVRQRALPSLSLAQRPQARNVAVQRGRRLAVPRALLHTNLMEALYRPWKPCVAQCFLECLP